MSFRLAPRSVTLDDPELLKVQIFSEFCAISHFVEASFSELCPIYKAVAHLPLRYLGVLVYPAISASP